MLPIYDNAMEIMITMITIHNNIRIWIEYLCCRIVYHNMF